MRWLVFSAMCGGLLVGMGIGWLESSAAGWLIVTSVVGGLVILGLDYFVADRFGSGR